MSHEFQRKAIFDDGEELVTFAKAYYATEFPCLDADDCPPPDDLRDLAASTHEPSPEILAHLFACSDCFCLFRTARREEAPADWREYTLVFNIRAPHAAMFAASLACIALLSVALFLATQRTANQPSADLMTTASTDRRDEPVEVSPSNAATPSDKPSSQSLLSSSLSADTAKLRQTNARPRVSRPSTRDSSTVRRKTASGIAPNLLPPQREVATSRKQLENTPRLPLVTINLEQIALLRQANEIKAPSADNETTKTSSAITLFARRQRLRLRLPEGSRAGRYEINIADAFGNKLISAHAPSNGKTLEVTIELRSLEAKNYRLIVAREGEAPDYYSLSINP